MTAAQSDILERQKFANGKVIKTGHPESNDS